MITSIAIFAFCFKVKSDELPERKKLYLISPFHLRKRKTLLSVEGRENRFCVERRTEDCEREWRGGHWELVSFPAGDGSLGRPLG